LEIISSILCLIFLQITPRVWNSSLDSAVALFPEFPKDESWKEQPNAIKDWIDEAGISPRGDYGSDRVLDAV